MTKRDSFVAIAEVLTAMGGQDELVEFVGKEITRIDTRKAAPRKPTKGQLENEDIKARIVEGLGAEDETGATATEIAGFEGISVQKASQLLKQLVADGLVGRIEGKGKEKTRFVLAEVSAE